MRLLRNAFVFFIILIFTVAPSFGQEGDDELFKRNYIGGGFCFGSDIEQPGISIKSAHHFNEEWVFSPSLNFFFTDKAQKPGFEEKKSMFTINMDAHYLVPLSNEFIFYPIGGLSISRYVEKEEENTLGNVNVETDSDMAFGLNLGAGLSYIISSQIEAFTELKFVVSDHDQAVFTLGALYNLGE